MRILPLIQCVIQLGLVFALVCPSFVLQAAEYRLVKRLVNPRFAESFGHEVAYSPDGKQIAVGKYAIGVWDTQSGKMVLALDGHPGKYWGGLTGLVFTPDSRTLISSGRDSVVRAWDLASGKLKNEFHAPGFWVNEQDAFRRYMPIHSIELSKDGKFLAAVAHNWKVHLWNVDGWQYAGEIGESQGAKIDPVDGEFIPGVPAREGEVCWRLPEYFNRQHPDVHLSPDGKTLAITDLEHTVFWDLLSRQPKKSVNGGGKGAFTPNGREYVTATYGGVTVWNPESGEKLREFTSVEKIFTPICFSPDGGTFATGSDRGVGIRLWDYQTGQVRSVLGYGGGALDQIVFSPDGLRVAATVRRSQVHIFDVASGQQVHSNCHTDTVTQLAFSRDGQHLISGGRDASVRTWSTSSWEPETTVTLPEMYVSAMQTLESPARVLVGDGSGHSRIFTVPDLTLVEEFSHSDGVAGYVLIEDRMLVGLSHSPSLIEVWGLENGKRQRLSQHEVHPSYSLQISHSGDRKVIATGDYEGNIAVWEDIPSETAWKFAIDGNHTAAVSLSPDGAHLATLGRKGSRPMLQIWDRRRKLELDRETPGSSGITCAVWSPDGETLAIGSMGTPGLFLYRSGSLVEVPGSKSIWSLAFSADNHTLVAGEEWGAISVWKTE